MSRGSELLAQVLAAPDEDPPRLVYADFLMEQGDPRGEYIALQVQLKQRITPARRRQARERLRAIGVDFGAEAAKLVKASRWSTRRGFVDEVWASGAAFANGGADLLEAEPVRYANLDSMSASSTKALLKAGLIGRLSGLRLSGEPDFEALAGSEQLRSLRRLNLSYSGVGDGGLSALLEGGNLQVESLTLNDCGISDDGVAALAESAAMGHIKRLFVSRNEFGDDGAGALAKSSKISDMAVMSLGGNYDIGDEGGMAFASAELAGKLGRLEINPNEFSWETNDALRDVWGKRVTL